MTSTGSPSDGVPLPELSVRPELLDTVMYAAAMWEFQRLHFDAEWAQREGLPAPIVQGPLLGNYLARAVTEAMGPAARLERLEWRNRAVVAVGEQLRVGGTLGAPEPDGSRHLDLWIVDGSGTTVVSGSARVRAQQPDDGEDRS